MNSNAPEDGSSTPETNSSSKTSFLKQTVRVAAWTFGILLFVLAGTVMFRDSIVKFAVAKGGSYLTGTNVTLNDFSTTFSGKIRLSGFAISNPKGFSSSNAIEFKEIFVHIDIPSLFSDTIRINQISVNGMTVNFETNLNTTNLNTIQTNVENISNSGVEENPESGETEDANEGKQKAVFIAKLDTTDSSLAFTSSTINQTLNLPLPPVHMTDIGGKSIADTADELFGLLINSVSSAAGNVGGVLTEAGNQLGKSVSSAGKNVERETKKLGKDLEKAGKNLLNSFKVQFK